MRFVEVIDVVVIRFVAMEIIPKPSVTQSSTDGREKLATGQFPVRRRSSRNSSVGDSSLLFQRAFRSSDRPRTRALANRWAH